MKQSVNRITVDSRQNCYVFPEGIEPVENIAATAEIEPGVHVIRINKGSFSYFDTGEEQQPSVLLWIAGGKFKNKASEVLVGASWGCLNGYNDTYTLEVKETTKLHALFLDTNNSDNLGEIELSILSDTYTECDGNDMAKDCDDKEKKKVTGYYELKRNKDEQFYFVLKAGNAEIILTSELYEQRESAENGIASAQKYCTKDKRYKRKNDSNGKPYFKLKDGNHNLIGSSQGYSSESSRDKGIASVKRNGITDVIKDKTEVLTEVSY